MDFLSTKYFDFGGTSCMTLQQFLHNKNIFCLEGKFEYGVAEGIVDPGLNPISAFRLSVIQNSAVWAILNEVRVHSASKAA